MGTPVVNDVGSTTNRQQVRINEIVEFLVLNSATAATPLPNALRVESITQQAIRGRCRVTSNEQRVEYTPRTASGVGIDRCGYEVCDSREVCVGATVYITVIDAARQAPRTNGNNLNPDTEGNRSVPADTVNGEDSAEEDTLVVHEREQGGTQDDEPIKQVRVIDLQDEPIKQVRVVDVQDEPIKRVRVVDVQPEDSQPDDDDIFTWKDESDSRRLTEERELSGNWQFWSGKGQWQSNSWSQPSWGGGGSKSSKTSSNGRRKRQYYLDDDDGRVWGRIKGRAGRRCKY